MISIITPIYNSESYVKSTIDSVLLQSYKDWEMIIIDDHSSDNTYQVAINYAKSDKRIRVYQNTRNNGAAITRNRAVEIAEGKYIAFLDGDDLWLPQKLETQLEYMESKNILFSHSSYMLVDEKGACLGRRSTSPTVIDYNDLIKFNWIGTSTVMYNAKKLGKQYMPNIRNRQDWACWLQLTKLANAYFIDTPIVKYRARKDSISNSKIKLIKYHWEIYNGIENFNFFKSLLYLMQNLFKHYRNDKIINF